MIVQVGITLTGEAEKFYKRWVADGAPGPDGVQSLVGSDNPVADEMEMGIEADLREGFAQLMDCPEGFNPHLTPDIKVRTIRIEY